MKFVRFIFIAIALLLSACVSTPNTVVGTPDKTHPLDLDALVRIVDASEIPVIPENSVYLGTMRTYPSSMCSVEKTAEELIKKARALGANLVYVKNVESETYVYSTGMTMQSRTCKTVLADFLNVEEWSAK